MDVSMAMDTSGTALNNPCRITLPSTCSAKLNSIPTGVTQTVNCIIDGVPAGTGITATHTCYVDITAKTGYHGVSRLPIEFVEYDYGRSKFEQKQLTQSVRPSTTGIGPVELSLGGFQQPILYNYSATATQQQVTMITTIDNSGRGEIDSYESAYLFIPNVLLNNGQCAGSGNGWVCIDSDALDSCNFGKCNEGFWQSFARAACEEQLSYLKSYCNAFKDFMNNSIGDYTQFSYDDADALLNDDYSICFYNNEINTNNIETSKCVLSVGDVFNGDREALRKTLIIRGDVLYTYKVTGEAHFQVRDCDV
jgi:hypothetical protein